ncbi:MAG: VWA domain-containing protein [Acidobacteriota bacterium]|nr:VWA domain-containing protein [Acidobacteriota bacterium]
MKPRTWILLLAIFCAASRAESQTPEPQSPFGETVEVRRATLDVVVTAKNGQHVKGLGVGDFELLVNGRLQPVMGFEEIDMKRAPIDAPAPVADVPQVQTPAPSLDLDRRRNIILLLDLYSLDGQRRNEAIRAFRKFLAGGWSPGDQVMVAVWNRELHDPLTLTSDLAAVTRELDEITKLSEGGLGKDRRIVEMRIRFEMQAAQIASGTAPARDIQTAYDHSIESAGYYAEEQRKGATTFAADVEELMRGVAGVPGKKVLVLVGENFPQFPGLGVYEYVNELFNPYSTQIRMKSAPMLASARSLSMLVPKLTRAANAHGIAVHTISSGETPSETPTEQEHPTTRIAQLAEFTNNAGSFGTLSRDTGGVAMLGSRNFDLAMTQIANDLDHYYTLVWRIGSAEKKPQSIEVRTKDRSLVVRARKELVPKTLDEEIEDRAVASLYQQATPGSAEIQVQAGKPVAAGRNRIKIPVEVLFPSSLLTLVSQDLQEVGGFEVIIAASDGRNQLSEASRKAVDVVWESDAIPETVQYTVDVVVRESDGGSLAVTVVDRLGKTAWSRTVAIPEP